MKLKKLKIEDLKNQMKQNQTKAIKEFEEEIFTIF